MQLPSLTAVFLTLSSVRPAYAAEPFTITSPAFAYNGQLVLKNGGEMKENPNCRGDTLVPGHMTVTKPMDLPNRFDEKRSSHPSA